MYICMCVYDKRESGGREGREERKEGKGWRGGSERERYLLNIIQREEEEKGKVGGRGRY